MSEHVVYILAPVKKEQTPKELKEKMPRCPICGKAAFLSHDVIDGFDMGFSGGCASFCLKDGVHGIESSDDPKAPRFTGYSFKEVYDKWVNDCGEWGPKDE